MAYEERPIDPDSRELDQGLDPKMFMFTDYPEMRFDEDRPVLVGQDALNLHKSEEYIIRYPIKHGNLNVSPSYSM